MQEKVLNSLKPIVSLAKRRGFIYPGSEIYGGFANTYSYGPYGAELKKNIKDLFWQTFVRSEENIYGIDGPILLHPKTWEASGHVEGFNDALIDCKECKARFRADHLIENALKIKVEGLLLEDLNRLIKENGLKCPECGSSSLTDARNFNLMFKTQMKKTSEGENDVAYLRPETAQAIFLEYKNIIDTMRVKLPFGIAQIGKAFRNEITPGNFIFRTIEFEQMEIEYFIKKEDWKPAFDMWLEKMDNWCKMIGLKKERLHHQEHTKEQLSHYSKRTVDIAYDFPFGRSELYGLAYRTDFDLSRHKAFSKVPQEYRDPQKNERFIPHVIEPTFGVDRTILALLSDGYLEETLESGEKRTLLQFLPKIAPVKVAIFPLMKKEELVKKAKKVHHLLKTIYNTEYDDGGAIGRRYRRQDELGTPFCITVDFESLDDKKVTIRDRDSMKQERVSQESILDYLKDHL